VRHRRLARTRPSPQELPLFFGGPDESLEAVRDDGPGCFQVDLFAAAVETLSSGQTARQLGVIIHRPDRQML
jgi:hypothetical protein